MRHGGDDLNVYADLFDDDLDEVGAAMDALLLRGVLSNVVEGTVDRA